MSDLASRGRLARFGAFEVDVRAGELRRNGLKQRLSGQPFQVLLVLLANAGEVVSRDKLRTELWTKNTFVDFDHGIGVTINTIREALGDSAESPRYIETLRGRGYRFIAPVRWEDGNGALLSLPSASGIDGARVPRSNVAVAGWRQAAPWAVAATALLALMIVALRYRRAPPALTGAVIIQIPPPAKSTFVFSPNTVHLT